MAILGPEHPSQIHGWIDQAVLEVAGHGPLREMGSLFLNYRPDQGGDSCALALRGDETYMLIASFEGKFVQLRRR